MSRGETSQLNKESCRTCSRPCPWCGEMCGNWQGCPGSYWSWSHLSPKLDSVKWPRSPTWPRWGRWCSAPFRQSSRCRSYLIKDPWKGCCTTPWTPEGLWCHLGCQPWKDLISAIGPCWLVQLGTHKKRLWIIVSGTPLVPSWRAGQPRPSEYRGQLWCSTWWLPICELLLQPWVFSQEGCRQVGQLLHLGQQYLVMARI